VLGIAIAVAACTAAAAAKLGTSPPASLDPNSPTITP
jgi:hypothetical protein